MRILIPYFLLMFLYVTGHSQPIAGERYYLQTDKAGYVAGETIWFKAYVFLDFYPVEDASTLIVDLVDRSGNVKDSRYLPITGGTAAGHLDLPIFFPEGMYLLKLYTRGSSKSSTQAGRYDKSVYVFNPAVKDSLPAPIVSPGYEFGFYPGPRTLVAGIQNELYFKTTDVYDLPAHVAGVIRDSKDREVLRFKDQFEGRGKVEFIPAAGERYNADLSFPGGVKKTVPLPPVQTGGVALQVETVPTGKRLQVTVTGHPFENQLLTLIGVMANSVVFKKEVSITDSYTCIVPTGELPAGPIHLFVFDASKKPITSVTSFVTGETSYQALDFSADTLDTSPGGHNVYSLKFPDSTTGTFSISITDYDREFSFSKNNILSDLLFYQQDQGQSSSSPLRMQAGEAGNDSHFQLLAATTAWPSIDFDDAMTPVAPRRIPDTNYLSIRGKVYNKTADKLLKDGELTFVFKAKDSTTAFLSAPIEKDGSFGLKNLLFYDTALFKYQLNNKKTEILIKLDSVSAPLFLNPYENIYPVRPLQSVELKAEAIAALKLSYKYLSDTSTSVTILKEVVVVSRTRTPTQIVNDRYTRGVFQSSGMARTVDLISYPPNTTAGNILDYLQSKVTGLAISKNGLTYTLTSQRQLSLSNNPPVKLFLNEQEVTADFLLPIPIMEIALVKYYSPGNNLPGVGIAGVLSIYTKKPSDQNAPSDPALKNGFLYPGYSTGKSFQDTGDGNERTGANPAKTLYWNPNILIDNATKPYLVQFKNNSARRFHIVVEGFTTDGKLLYFEKTVGK